MKIEAELETVIEGKPILIKFNNIKFISQGNPRSDASMFRTSAAMVCCWIRFKAIKEFNLSDLKEGFPEWRRYSRSSLLNILQPLLKEKRLMQCPNDVFKVLKKI